MKGVLWACPGDSKSPWLLSGITRCICQELENRQLLAGTINTRTFPSRLPEFYINRVPLLRTLQSRFGAHPLGFTSESNIHFRQLVRNLGNDAKIVYQFVTPAIDSELNVSRFRLVDISLLDAVKYDAYGHGRLSTKEIDESFRNQERAFHSADGVLTLSTYAADAIARDFGVDRRKITPIGAGATIVPSICPSFSIDRYAKRRILFVGRDWQRKGGDLLLSAFQIVRKRLPDATLTIVGPANSPSSDAGIQYIPPINKGTKSGRRQLQQVFLNSSVFCMPSICETWGLVYSEACIFGCPIVGFNEWALPDIVQDDLTGFLASERSVDSLANRLLDALLDPEQLAAVAAAACKRFQTLLHWKCVTDRLLFRLGLFPSKEVESIPWMRPGEMSLQAGAE